MAPKHSTTTTTSNQELLVANKKATETSWTKKLQHPLFHTSNQFYFIDEVDTYEDVLTKMGSFCNRPVSRIFYIDSDNDEVPIDSEVEMKEALKLITERTDKGKFTKMRLATSNSSDVNSKRCEGERKPRASKPKPPKPKKAPKPKSAINKIIPKPTKCNDMAMTWKKETTSSILQTTPVDNVANVTESITEPVISQAWLESRLKELKLELLDDMKTFLAPLIQDQLKIKTLVGLIATQIAAPVDTMSPPESDHNYSAPNYCAMFNSIMNELEKAKNSTKSNPQASDLKPERQEDGVQCLIETCDECPAESLAECTAQCSFNLDEDENLSILSGEISLTDSESDVEGTDDDFVDIPLPPCFNVIEPKTGFKLNKLGKEAKANKTGMRHEQTLKSKPSHFSQDQITNNESLKEHSLTKSILSEQESQQGQKTEECDTETVKKINECQNSFMEKPNRIPSSEHESKENMEDIDNGGSQDFDKSYGEKYNFFDAEHQCYKGKLVPSSSNVFPTEPECTEKNCPAPVIRASEQHMNPFQPAQQKHVPSVNDVASSQHPVLSMSNVSPVTILPGCPPPYMSKQVQQVWYPQHLQRSFLPSTQGVQQPTLATVMAQHQQILLAAQRAGQPTTRTLREFQTTQPAQQMNPFQRQPPMVAHQDTQPANHARAGAHGSENLSSESQGEKADSSGTSACGKEALSPDQRVWHEIVQIDNALKNWVQVCKQFMERVPNRIDETSTIPESCRRSSATATQTCDDLDKLYQEFRKEVHVARCMLQLDGCKPQGPEQSSAESEVHILPAKLLEIVSSTVNTTFNILGNISKLGMMNAPSSAPSDPRNTSFTGDKGSLPRASTSYSPLHSVSALSSLTNSLGNMRLAASQYLPYPYMGPLAPATDAQNSMSFEYMNNQDYRMRPAGVASSLNAQYPYLLGQNMSCYPSGQALGQTQIRTNVQAQSQPLQPHTQSPLTRQVPYTSSLRPMASQLQQQLFPPVPHQFS